MGISDYMTGCIFPRYSPESSGSSKTTLEEVGTNTPAVTLEDIVEELLSFLNKSVRLTRAKTEIKEKCDIEESDYVWSADDIKRAWGETQKITKKSQKRNWSLVILCQVIKRRLYNKECKEAQSDLKDVKSSPILCHVAEENTPCDSKQVPSETEERDKMVKAKRNDGANSNSKTTLEGEANLEDCMNKLSVNEEEKVQNDRRSTDGIEEVCKAQSMKENPDIEMNPDTAAQRNVETTRGTKRKAKSESLISTSVPRDDLKDVSKRDNVKRRDDGSWEGGGSNKSNSQTVYIRIPFSVMAGNESPSSTDTEVTNDHPTYKLIDRVPYLTEIRKRKSYAMLYDNRTKNAAWVYEILNSETLKEEVERKDVFSVDQSIHPFYQTSNGLYQDPYVRGHLAAAANHRWCREACDDTFLMSNISPQHKGLNNGSWKTLENGCQKKIGNNIRNVHVYSGPLYLPKDRVVNFMEMGGKAVPTHFFKVIIVEHNDDVGKVELECYKMPNESLQDKRGSDDYEMPNQKLIESYSVTIEEIERDSGLIFRENSCSEGETDSLREVTWTGEIKDEKTCTVKTKVKISTPRIVHSINEYTPSE